MRGCSSDGAVLMQDGSNPIHLAAWKGNHNVIKALIPLGGDYKVLHILGTSHAFTCYWLQTLASN